MPGKWIAAVAVALAVAMSGPIAALPALAQSPRDVCDPQRALLSSELEQGRITAEPLIACLTKIIDSDSLEGISLGLQYGVRASIFQLSGQFERAVEDNNRAIALVKEPRMANIMVGQRCFVLGMLSRFSEALRDCDRAIAVEPGFFLYWSYRATIFLKMGENAKALQGYNESLRLLELHPASDSALDRYGRGVAKRRLGDKRGGDADISVALAASIRTRDTYASWGITE